MARSFISRLLLGALVHCLSAQDERAIFVRGEQALRSGDYSSARAAFELVLKLNPAHLPALANLGVTFSQTRQYAEAVEVYKRALRVSPRHPLLHLNLGLAWFKQDRCREAVPEFEQTLKHLPANEQARELLAACQIQLGSYREAANAIDELLRTRPDDSGLLYLQGLVRLKQGNAESARAAFARLLATAPAAQAHYLAGKAHYENDEFEEAERELLLARAGDPAMEGIDRELGKVYISLRKSEDAAKHLRAAATRDSGDVEARYFLAGALLLEDLPADALPLFQEVAAERPEFWGAHYYRGRILLQQSNAAGAIPALERAAQLAPSESSVFYQLARAYRQLGRQADAEAALKKMKELQQRAASDSELLRRK